MKKILGILFVTFLTTGCASSEGQIMDNQMVQKSESCATAGGKWIEEHQECEYASKEWCETAGGVFEECGSACRHDPMAEMCTQQCVIFCKF